MIECLISLGGGHWQVPAIMKARALTKVLVIDSDRRAAGAQVASFADYAEIAQPREVLAAIERHGVKPIGVISHCNDAGLVSSAVVRETYGLSGAILSQTLTVRDKERQYKVLSEAGIEIPPFVVVSGETDITLASSIVGFPFILKPTIGSGSRDVFLIASAQILKSLFDCGAINQLARWVVQRYVPGVEYAAEIFGDGSSLTTVAVFEKSKLDGTDGLVSESLTTVLRTDGLFSSIAEVAERAVGELGLLFGPCHVEVMKDESGQLHLLEVNGRGGGFGVQDVLVPAASGVDITSMEVRLALGEEVSPPRPISLPAVMTFLPSQSGILESVRGAEDLNRMDGVSFEMFQPVGYEGSVASQDGDRVGWILAQAPSIARAKKLARLAKQSIFLEFI